MLRWLPVQKDEIQATAALSSLHFLIIGAFTLARIARDGLFLAELPAQKLPYVFLGLAVWTAVVVIGFSRLTSRIATERTLLITLIGTGLSLVLFSAWFTASGRTAAVTFYLWIGAYGPILVSQFWLLANERINSRQAKRLFSVIGAAGILGGMVGGGLTTMLAGMLPAQNLLLIAAGIHLAAAGVLRVTGTCCEERSLTAESAVALRMPLREPYVRLLALVFLVGGITAGVLDYQFKFILQNRWEDPARITSVLGYFYGTQNVVALLAQLGLASLLLRNIGARRAAMILPVGVALGSAGTLVLAAAPVVVGTRLFDATLRVSLVRTAWEFLYFPLSTTVRRQAKRFVEVVVNRAADAGAGLVILLLNSFLGGSLQVLTLTVLLLALSWLILERRLSRAYAAEVSFSLARQVTAEDRPEATLADVASQDELVRMLQDPVESKVLYALDVLERLDFEVIKQNSEQLLRYSSSAIRARTLAILASHGENFANAGWQPHANGELVPSDAVIKIPLPEDSAERVVQAIEAVLDLQTPEAQEHLPELFDDPEPDVRKTAFRSAGLLGKRAFVPILVTKLLAPQDRKFARDALIAMGDRIAGTLGDYLVDPSVSVTVRKEITRILGAIGTSAAAASLFRSADFGQDRIVVTETLRAMNRLRLRDTSLIFPREIVGQRITEEIHRYCRRVVQQRAIQSLEEPELLAFLQRVLREREQQSLERIFRRLAMFYPPRDTLLALRGYLSDNPRLRAQSVDYLETVLEPEHKQLILPVLEQESAAGRVRQAGMVLQSGSPSVFGTIAEMLESRESWLNSCGLFAVGTLKLSILKNEVSAARRTTDPIIGDVARWAWRQLSTPEGENMEAVQTLSVIEKSIFLMKLDAFKDLATDEVALIAARAGEVRFETGEIIAEDGEYGTSAIFVVAGAIEQRRGEVLLRRATSEMAVGLYGLMGMQEIGEYVVQVTEPTHGIVLSQEDFFAALTDYPEFGINLVRGLTRVIVKFEKRIEELEKLAAAKR